jgi:hypothetical protein
MVGRFIPPREKPFVVIINIIIYIITNNNVLRKLARLLLGIWHGGTTMSDAMLDSEMHNDNYEESGLLSLYLKEINRIRS